MNFGEELKKMRLEKGLSIRKLAELSGISHAYISQIENGKRDKPKPELLKKLSGPLNIPLIELMYNAGHIDHLPAAVDFLSADFEEIKVFFPELNTNHDLIGVLEEKYSEVLEHGSITQDKLKALIYEEPLKDGVANLFHDLKVEIKRLQSIGLQRPEGTDLRDFLKGSGKIQLNGHTLSPREKQRILIMLETMFPEYSKK